MLYLYLILIFLLLLVLAIVIYLATLDGSYTIRRSLVVNADIYITFDKISDFKSWPDWSPWLIHEPDTKLEFSKNYCEPGAFYTWDGHRIGAGKLSHVAFNRPNTIEQKLEFSRPFKSVCDVSFEFSDRGTQTEVSWIMRGKMPFLFRFMTEKTKDMISKDYDFGLAMLNGQLDPNAEHPELQFEGETTLEPNYSLCKGFSGGLQAMEKVMPQDFPKLLEYIKQQQGKVSGSPFTAYHKSDPKTLQFVCDMAIPVAKGIDAGDYQLKTLGGGRFYKVTLKGSYQFLELAWYSAIAHVQMHKLKFDKSRASLEVYENDPNQMKASNEILTTLYVAIK